MRLLNYFYRCCWKLWVFEWEWVNRLGNDIKFMKHLMCVCTYIYIYIYIYIYTHTQRSFHHLRIDEVIWLWNDIWIFLKHHVHLKWYQFFQNDLSISNDINFYKIPCPSKMISNFLKYPVHLKWYQFFWNTMYISNDINNTLSISNDINFSITHCTFQMISIFPKWSIHLKW